MMAEKPKTKKKPAEAPLSRMKKQPAPPSLEWEEVVRNGIWKTTTVPDGDKCTASIKRSSLNSDGSYSFYCYRNARVVGITRDLEDAKKRVASGEISDNKAMLDYITNHALEIPPFLLLSEDERRAVRSSYPYAAPTEARMRGHAAARGGGRDPATRPGPDARDLSDPSTVRFLEYRARVEAASAAGGAAESSPARGAPTVRGGKKAALSSPGARLSLVGSPENPGKPGSKRHAGYKIILDAAAAGQTVAEALAAGADPLRLGKCVARGLVELKQ